jgi:hypothetical protein
MTNFKLTALLADSAQAVGGKLYILGGGWSVTGPDPAPSAIAVKIDVPWDHTNQSHRLELKLLDQDGNSVEVPTDDGSQPLVIAHDFEVGRPPGLPPGTPLDYPVAINLPPIPYPLGQRLVWHISIDGHSEEDWHLSFTTRSAQPPMRMAG